VEEVDAADRDRPDRVAVVGLAHADEAGPRRVAALLVVLEGHLQRDLGGGRPGVRVEDPLQPLGGDLDQPLRQFGRAGVGQSQHRRVGDLVELGLGGGVEDGVVMAVDVAPQRGGAVEVPVAIDVVEVDPLAALDHQRRLLAPSLLLGEGVPDELLVEVVEAGGVGHRFNPNRTPPSPIPTRAATIALAERLRSCNNYVHASKRCQDDRAHPEC
jgi:hypothetical protein